MAVAYEMLMDWKLTLALCLATWSGKDKRSCEERRGDEITINIGMNKGLA